MSFSQNTQAQSENEDDEIHELLFPFLQHAPCLQNRAEQAHSRDRYRPVGALALPALLEKLLPPAPVRQPTKEQNRCCLCLEDLEEGSKYTKGLGCSCKSTFYHTTCFENYLNSCETVASCPCCRCSWSEDLVIID